MDKPTSAIEVALIAMQPQHLDAVLQVEQRAYPHPWTHAHFADALRTGYQAQMLMAGDTLLGYWVAMPGVDEVHLLNITVAPPYQRQGWGRMLLDALTLWARGQVAHWVWLEVRVSNVHAIAVYQARGFAQLGRRKAYYPADNGQREDALVMGLNLITPPAAQQGSTA
jgi:[ribosomal protein S18]-alanine N-acetyltransferase